MNTTLKVRRNRSPLMADRQATTQPVHMVRNRRSRGYSGPGTASTSVDMSTVAKMMLFGPLYTGYKLFQGSGWGPQSNGITPAKVVTNDLSMGQGGPGGPYYNVATGQDPTTTKIPGLDDVNASKIPGWVAPVGIGLLLLTLSGGAAAFMLKKGKSKGKTKLGEGA